MLYVAGFAVIWAGLIALGVIGNRGYYGNAIKVFCPYCGDAIWGTYADIDSGLRKHLEYCDVFQSLD